MSSATAIVKPAEADTPKPAFHIDPTFIQDTAADMHARLAALHRVVSQWRDHAQARKQVDPAFVVIEARETARTLFAFADTIEANARTQP